MTRYQDLTGQRFGRLVVTERTAGGWLCRCDCGNDHFTRAWPLTAGRTKSCGCLHRESVARRGAARATDLTGQRFGLLLVLHRVENRYHQAAWQCRCDCGNVTSVVTYSLKHGLSRSCGCMRLNGHSVITYEGAHWRIRQARGPAVEQECNDCGDSAGEWSYDYLDPDQITCETRGSLYSLKPEHYVARCASCHKKHDLKMSGRSPATTTN